MAQFLVAEYKAARGKRCSFNEAAEKFELPAASSQCGFHVHFDNVKTFIDQSIPIVNSSVVKVLKTNLTVSGTKILNTNFAVAEVKALEAI